MTEPVTLSAKWIWDGLLIISGLCVAALGWFGRRLINRQDERIKTIEESYVSIDTLNATTGAFRRETGAILEEVKRGQDKIDILNSTLLQHFMDREK